MFRYPGEEAFTPGDEAVIPFLIVAGRTIANISDGVVTGEVWVRGSKVRDLTVGDGIEIEQVAPAAALKPEDQIAHGVVRLVEAFTVTLPEGQWTQIKLFFINGAGVRMSCAPILMRGCS